MGPCRSLASSHPPQLLGWGIRAHGAHPGNAAPIVKTETARGRRQPAGTGPRLAAPSPPQRSRCAAGEARGAPRPICAPRPVPPSDSPRPCRGDSASGDPLRAGEPALRREPPAARSGRGAAPPSPPSTRRPLTPAEPRLPHGALPRMSVPAGSAPRAQGPRHRAGASPLAAARSPLALLARTRPPSPDRGRQALK